MRVQRNAGICAFIYGATLLSAPATSSAQILTSGSAVNRSDPASATSAPLPGDPETVPSTKGVGSPATVVPTTSSMQAPAPASPTSSLWGRRTGGPATTSPPTAASSPSPSTESISGWRPLIDTKGVDSIQYEKDLSDCQAFASQNREADREQVTRSAIKGGLFSGGLMVGATILTGGAALLPMMAGAVATTAGVGALSGAAGGAAVADAAWRGTVSSCLSGRGYRVLN